MKLEPEIPGMKEAELPATAADSVAGPLERLYGVRDPYRDIQRERPEHRTALYMFASGQYSQKDVAEALGVTPTTVSAWRKQPWFQARLQQIIEAHGGKDIMDLFKGEMTASFNVLCEIRDDPTTPKAVRANIGFGIIERVMGKTVQRIETKELPRSEDPVAEARRLEQENSRLGNELRN